MRQERPSRYARTRQRATILLTTLHLLGIGRERITVGVLREGRDALGGVGAVFLLPGAGGERRPFDRGVSAGFGEQPIPEATPGKLTRGVVRAGRAHRAVSAA